jgi:DNA-binding XRE family transcriptional regulator
MNDTAGAEIDRLHNGRHLRAARTLAGLTQQQLADAAGIHVNAVRYWEADDRKHSRTVAASYMAGCQPVRRRQKAERKLPL